ncbi:conserved hypothetical protein [Leishmania major strain Friedlin]|uniref:Uncharacterized protein n=1 Tax=Leishmania major TaxID=5664 RepID=Q4QC82_LEIMA|nr:conserved hypothetical protein [Leishmania major strain Friedlin]CAG9573496.1 hypothetical_protein_-_conserved [Leishmania major strain Friedlin]CAJ04586.1 conserved hypothetical protein [Leishmania major strain Friedlin]|eukprot:XP_001683066.1 conserved hypothetical protein [Leishmania major strain Friedlin]
MKAIHGGGRIAATTCVHVEVKGSLDIPLNLSLLADLGDPMVEQEIIKEAVRIAVSERLGCFGGVEVHLSSSGGREGGRAAAEQKARQRETQMQPQEAEATASSYSHGMENSCCGRYCEASVNLEDLGSCIESIQKAYEGLLMHAQLLHELLNTDTATAPSGAADVTVASTPQSQQPSDFDAQADAVKRLAAARQLVADMVADHRSGVVAEAAALQDGASPQRLASHETDMLADEHAEATAMIHARRYGKRPSHDDDTDAGLRFGLLAGGDEDAEEQQRQQQAEDRKSEEELRARYMELGYSPL